MLITIPIALTWIILNFLFKNLDSLAPVFTNILIKMHVPIPEGYRIPFLGVIMTLLSIMLIGMFATNIFGKRLVHLGERIVAKIPFVRRIYSGIKQVVLSFANADTTGFTRVVLIEFPRRGINAIGFVTGEARGEVQRLTKDKVINVFVPTTPNPTSGFLIMVPEEDTMPLEMDVEAAFKLVISGGMVTEEVEALKDAVNK